MQASCHCRRDSIKVVSHAVSQGHSQHESAQRPSCFPLLLLDPPPTLDFAMHADHERTGRTNVSSRATSSFTISPSCTAGCLQMGQGGAVARGMKCPKQQPRQSAECPLPSQASCASAQRQRVKNRNQTRADKKRKQTYHPKRT